jgi:peptidyl-tRNA hydrolase, PTH2 family
METKQVIILRKDLNMRKGKMIAQGAHASLRAYYEAQKTNRLVAEAWFESLSTKVCVGVSSEQALQDAYAGAVNAGLPCAIITDAGKTEFNGVPTKTAVAIGPGPVEEIDKITGSLTLL